MPNDRIVPKINWLQRKGQLAACLVEPERGKVFDQIIGAMVDDHKPLMEIIDTLDEQGDISPQEWLSIGYALGYFSAMADAYE